MSAFFVFPRISAKVNSILKKDINIIVPNKTSTKLDVYPPRSGTNIPIMQQINKI